MVDPADPNGPKMLEAVQADLAELDLSLVAGGHTYREMALWLAGVIDKRGSEDGPSVTARLADQLGKVMAVLTRAKEGDGGPKFSDISDVLSTPVR